MTHCVTDEILISQSRYSGRDIYVALICMICTLSITFAPWGFYDTALAPCLSGVICTCDTALAQHIIAASGKFRIQYNRFR